VNFISNTLSHLVTVNNKKKSDTNNSNKRKLDILFIENTSPDKSIREEFYMDFNKNYIFIATLIKIEPAFKKQFLNRYKANKY
jgi:hypothetical protein